MTWIPDEFEPPSRVDLPTGHHLRPIRESDVDIDYPAVMGSQGRLWAKYGEAWGWPPASMTREEDREDLARHVGLSAGHLSLLLKERTGRSFIEMLREVRVQAVSEMLLDTARSLAEIAAACGFCDQSYMTHVFRDLRGMTPKQYRDRAQAGAIWQQSSS